MPEGKHFSGFLLLFFFLFATGIILIIPFPYWFIPDTGSFLSPFTLSVLENIWQKPGLTLASDTEGMKLAGLTWAGISAVLSAMLFLQKQWRISLMLFIHQYFPSFVSFYLSLQLFRYGWDKVFKHQFPFPEANILFTPLGNLDKDILYWSTMGSSYSFTVFGGIMEVIPAALLIFRKTRILGAWIAFMVMLQVVMINIGFDITVKYLSFFLLSLALYLILPGSLSVIHFFTSGKPIALPEQALTPLQLRFPFAYVWLKTALIVLILSESLYPFVRTRNFNDDKAPRLPYLGAYDVVIFSQNGDTLPTENPKRWKRIFFHRQHYCILQSADDTMLDFPCDFDTISNHLTLFTPESQIIGSLNITRDTKYRFLSLTGTFHQDSVFWDLRRIVR